MASPAKAPYEISEVTQFEASNRSFYNAGNTLALYIFFADGGVTDDTSMSFTLGTAYRNTSLVVYEKSVQMHWEAESNRITSMMGGGIPQLDANCIADLQANGGK